MEKTTFNKLLKELDHEIIAAIVLPGNSKSTRERVFEEWSEDQKLSAMSGTDVEDALLEAAYLQDMIIGYISYMDGIPESDVCFKLTWRYLGDDAATLSSAKDIAEWLSMAATFIAMEQEDEIHELENYSILWD